MDRSQDTAPAQSRHPEGGRLSSCSTGDTSGSKMDKPSPVDAAESRRRNDGKSERWCRDYQRLQVGRFQLACRVQLSAPTPTVVSNCAAGYEVKIETDSVQQPAGHHAGGVYGYLTPSLEMPASQESGRISILHLVRRRITLVQNGQTIIDDQEIPAITGRRS